jgi:hypothetical protein
VCFFCPCTLTYHPKSNSKHSKKPLRDSAK